MVCPHHSAWLSSRFGFDSGWIVEQVDSIRHSRITCTTGPRVLLQTCGNRGRPNQWQTRQKANCCCRRALKILKPKRRCFYDTFCQKNDEDTPCATCPCVRRMKRCCPTVLPPSSGRAATQSLLSAATEVSILARTTHRQ